MARISKSTFVPIARFSPHLAAQAAPMIAALRANGVEPTGMLICAAPSGERRRARQRKARAFKLLEATARREAKQHPI